MKASTVEAASTGGGLWYSYLFLMLYMLIAVSGVTHADLLTSKTLTLPVLNVNLPLLGFFWLAPLLLVISHAYVLLHFSIMRSKLQAFTTELLSKTWDIEAQEFARRQLPNSIFIQLLAGPREIRKGTQRVLLLIISFVSLAMGPVFVLFLFLLQFLPYHHEGLTWWHRLLIMLDLVLLIKLWPLAAMSEGGTSKRSRFISIAVAVLLGVMTVTVTLFPGEWLDEHSYQLRFIPTAWPNPHGVADDSASPAVKEKPRDKLCETEFNAAPCPSVLSKVMRVSEDFIASMKWISLRTLLLEGDVDLRTGKPLSLFSNRLVLPSHNNPGAVLFEERSTGELDATLSLRARNLQGAVFINANFRGADFTAANLRGAVLIGADLRGAKMGCASSQLNGAGSNFVGTYVVKGTDCTQLQNADLSAAFLQKTSIGKAVFSKTKFAGANLREASLSGANMPGTDFSYADLSGANLMNAVVDMSNMSHAKLIGAHLQYISALRVDFSGAKLGLAWMEGADLKGAVFKAANLDGTSFIKADGVDPETWEKSWPVSRNTTMREKKVASVWLAAVCDSKYPGLALQAVLLPLGMAVEGQYIESHSPFLKNSPLPYRLIERFRDSNACKGARFFTDDQRQSLEDMANQKAGVSPHADVTQ
ncbi:pentapeptide repeat-containing protein [Pseudomonas japonica]|uniref:Uncharacterized protein YjbI, contains pentapeptide repeats n=1 Tax=Pseudomonas japonica TaxID=256466 RepID=A0A239HSW4_9PSED|nr:pentapeptide repeat-containing protein [Pseudomonas japonica]SNS83374.1 Uncharacterized protein YjbI, contains pentapeptide repeats [Pseudomonas japonica]